RQLDEMLAAAPGHGLWTELEELLTHLAPQRMKRMTTRFTECPEQVREAYAAAGKPARKVLAALGG
ncbi:MAG: hypothetical protein ABI251_11830, partial [Mycobacteriaceae bacterium]